MAFATLHFKFEMEFVYFFLPITEEHPQKKVYQIEFYTMTISSQRFADLNIPVIPTSFHVAHAFPNENMYVNKCILFVFMSKSFPNLVLMNVI